jgi:hypothetical protein
MVGKICDITQTYCCRVQNDHGSNRTGSSDNLTRASKYEDTRRSKKLEQVPGSQSRGKTEKTEQKWVGLNECPPRAFLIVSQKIKQTTKIEISRKGRDPERQNRRDI